MPLTAHNWHKRFQQQATWTKTLRDHLFPRAGLDAARQVIEIGCGTGALLTDLQRQTEAIVHGLDIDRTHLSFARRHLAGARLVQGDAHALPFSDGSFDLAFCHYLLLWVEDPAIVLAEMARVTRPGGAVLALAEPDYGGRVDYPDELAGLGALQMDALRRQGANPLVGRRLSALLHQAGLGQVETGVLGGRWEGPPSREAMDMEWMVLRDDLAGMVSAAELDAAQARDMAAWERGARVLYVPTFYAWGRKEWP